MPIPIYPSTDHECIICNESNRYDLIALDCGHGGLQFEGSEMHFECVVQLFQHVNEDANASCPICRADIERDPFMERYNWEAVNNPGFLFDDPAAAADPGPGDIPDMPPGEHFVLDGDLPAPGIPGAPGDPGAPGAPDVPPADPIEPVEPPADPDIPGGNPEGGGEPD
ncbi:RING finger protein [Paenibacillus monticola]|uniref:RING-type domain-containing protein n=1 Tax=Paenibacillus monticola TaxID=2666075 RepID=A0A7X2H7N7_9BACL|nr:RING finger protein [Paenibacillus monticola]MRN55047.1 hypothetical protein [Paenibacillus monticola]